MTGESYRVDRFKRSEREEVSARFCLEQVAPALFSSSRLKQIELWKSWSCREAPGGVFGTDLKFSPLCVSFQELVESTVTRMCFGEGCAWNQTVPLDLCAKKVLLKQCQSCSLCVQRKLLRFRRCRSIFIRAGVGKIPSALKEPLPQGTRTLYALL